MPQHINAQPQRHLLHRIEGEVVAQARERGSPLVTEEDQDRRADKQPGFFARQNLINEPLQNQRREKRQQAGGGRAEKAGNVPAHKRSDPVCEPMQFTGDLRRQNDLPCSGSRHWLGHFENGAYASSTKSVQRKRLSFGFCSIPSDCL